ncbi:ligand-binding protein SH3 [Deinococcus sp. KSM4-11]|uniref:SH3 domain-containing protein n=1 Tax=Deinococcus sp. KSM4-11 TaxID=2568654 RepID=UPI0010A310C1|nr:excalibur calcium-binding domain-containing protein [Deinococcus sp. KSM4-11]THF85253.1 ligand-binding protein SH3 [Deinococcus sp. KSM4-11]
MRQLMKTGLLGLTLLGLGTGMADAATAYTNTGANLRRGPTTDAPVLRVVPGGTLLTVACVGQWCRTSYQGRGGYVSRSVLRAFTSSAPVSGVFYASCAVMRAQGKAPLKIGQIGYRTGLDSNRNGVACDQGDRQR